MKLFLFSLLFVAVKSMPGPLVNLTKHVIEPIGETFKTVEITTPAPKIEPVNPIEVLPIFKPIAVETTVEGLILPDPLPVEEAELPEDTLTTILNGILPTKLAAFIAKLITLAVTTIALLFFGKAITAALGQFLNVKNASEIVSETNETVERVKRAVEFLQHGIEKYEGFQSLGELYTHFIE